MNKFALCLIYLVFILAFFGNLFVDYHILPPEFTLLTEISVYLLFILSLISKSITGERYSFDLWYVFGFLALIGIISAFVNHMSVIRLIVSARLIFRFYLFYLALINLTFEDSDFKKINTLLFIIFLAQLPACAIRFYYYGISELTIGTYASHGGGLTPIIPVVAIAYLTGFFSYYRRKFIYIVLIIAFILYGIAGEKRVLFIMYPFVFCLMYSILWIERKGLNWKFFAGWIFIIAFSLGISAFMLSAIKTLNPEHKQWGSIDFRYAFNYVKKYTTTRRGKVGGGRLATTIIAFEYLMDGGIPRILGGYGPGSLTHSIVEKKRFIDRRISGLARSYGLNGMSYISVEYGILGLLCLSIMFFVFIFRTRKWYKSETDSYWKSISFGSYIFAIYITIMFFIYNRAAIMGDTITPVMYYIMAVTWIRSLKRKNNNAQIDINNEV